MIMSKVDDGMMVSKDWYIDWRSNYYQLLYSAKYKNLKCEFWSDDFCFLSFAKITFFYYVLSFICEFFIEKGLLCAIFRKYFAKCCYFVKYFLNSLSFHTRAFWNKVSWTIYENFRKILHGYPFWNC